MNGNSLASRLTGPSAVLIVSVFLNFSGLTLVDPVVPFLIGHYVQQEQIAPYIGLIGSTYALCEFIAAPVLGACGDRFGRRPVLIASLFGSALGYLVLGIGGSIWILFAGRVIDGLSAGNISTLYACAADVTPTAEQARLYGLLGAAGGAGFIVGPVAAGLLGEISPSIPLFAAAALMLLNILWVYVAVPESHPRELRKQEIRWNPLGAFSHYSAILHRRSTSIAFAAAFLFFFSGAMMQSNFSAYLMRILHFGPFDIGMVLLAVGVMDILSQGMLTRKLLPRFGNHRIIRAGLLINAVGFVLIAAIAFASSTALLIPAILVFTLGDGLFQPAMNALATSSPSPENQGQLQGAYQGQQALARLFAPLLAAICTMLGAATPYWVGATLIVLALAIFSGRSALQDTSA
ncbi:TCR/Tet family MFS transporter [Rhizobium rhizogenes]|uniref:MFS transporter n=1 Tax=Rhizobium rhizogenes TaxID=359 RepID=UPI0015719909|nr:MFS transporter [Rhizobium rhizogenes]NTI24976.1 TCR/Tet family MFS transporter [Rhizobium rhizogenes]QTG08011.1 TCR/Tet family MFS transporter [Rhizobium rhizogenes]